MLKTCNYLYMNETEIGDGAKICTFVIKANGGISGEMRFQNRQL